MEIKGEWKWKENINERGMEIKGEWKWKSSGNGKGMKIQGFYGNGSEGEMKIKGNFKHLRTVI